MNEVNLNCPSCGGESEAETEKVSTGYKLTCHWCKMSWLIQPLTYEAKKSNGGKTE